MGFDNKLKAGQRVELHDPNNPGVGTLTSHVEAVSQAHALVQIPIVEGRVYTVHSGMPIILRALGDGKAMEIETVVVQRLHAGSVVCMALEPVKNWKSIQRRGYFRMDLIVDGLMEIVETVEEEPITIRNLSAGGMRFVALRPLQKGDMLRITYPVGDDVVKHFLRVIDSEKVEMSIRRHVIRGEFINITEQDRTKIMAVLFEMQRKKRKKGLA